MHNVPVQVLVWIVVFLSSNFANAHRAHFGWTSVTLGADSIEIIHRVHEHDAAEWLIRETGSHIDITQLAEQARFALYVADNFQIQIDQTRQIPELVGAELLDHYLVVYQELPIQKPRTSVELFSKILMDLHADQVHVVDIKLAPIFDTVEFSRDSKPQLVPATNASTY